MEKNTSHSLGLRFLPCDCWAAVPLGLHITQKNHSPCEKVVLLCCSQPHGPSCGHRQPLPRLEHAAHPQLDMFLGKR